MIILLYGSDNYRSRQKLNEIVNHYQKTAKTGFNLMFFDDKKLDFTDFKDVFKQRSMFNEKKLVVLFNCFDNKDFKEKLYKNIDPLINSKDVLLIYQETDILKRDSFLNFLMKKAKVQQFDILKGEKLKDWVKQEFNRFNTEISLEALNKMIDFIGSDLWLFSNEIKKLVNYKKNKKINPQDIDLLVKPKIETAIFKTIDAIAQKDKKTALILINQHLDKGENPVYLLSMISFQFRNLLMVKDFIEKGMPYYSVLKLTGLHPFVVRKSFQQADRFTFQELKKIHQKIFQADLDIKTGKNKPETVLDLLIAKM